MIELLHSIRHLCDKSLRPDQVTLLGLRLGDPALSIRGKLITDVSMSPIVRRARHDASGTVLLYFDAAGRQLSFEERLTSVLQETGWVHCGDVRFRVKDRVIVEFGIGRSALSVLRRIRKHSHFLSAFGAADEVDEQWDYGDLMRIYYWYAESKKHVVWDWTESRIDSVNIGESLLRETREVR